MAPLAEIRAEIPAARADEVEEALLEFSDPSWSLQEDALSGRAWIVGIFPAEPAARAGWEALRGRLPPGVGPEPQVRPLAQEEWKDSYKAHFHAWRFGRLHWVPVWERPSFRPPPGEAVLWLDPGLAFGTGNHETTRLCIERLVALAEARGTERLEGMRVVDAGCGSGILALSAALLGFGRVRGFDVDPEAVRVSRENAVLNGLAGRVGFGLADLTQGLDGPPADVLLANIQADVLRANARELTGALAPGGTLILSGILAAEAEAVRAEFERAAPGWKFASRALGQWSDLAGERP